MVKFGGASPARSSASSTRRCAPRSRPTAAPATASPARPRSCAPAASASSPTRTPLYTLSPLGRGQGEGRGAEGRGAEGRGAEGRGAEGRGAEGRGAEGRGAEGSMNVLLTRDGPIATVTLNRPDRRNSLSDEMLTDLGAAFAELRDDASTRVVIVTGAPPVFSAGADAGHAKAATPEERRRLFLSRKSQFRRLFERANAVLENLEQATIAAVNGHAVGGAWGLAHRVVPGAGLAAAVADYAGLLAKKPFRPMAEVKARINAIARTGIPE